LIAKMTWKPGDPRATVDLAEERRRSVMRPDGPLESPGIATCATTDRANSRNWWATTRPVRHRLTTLFVDIAGSTSLLVQHPPETVLHVVQCFMRLVTDVAYACSGAVKDYEGDGALLYFQSTRDAVRAALTIRAELAAGRCDATCGGGPGVAARMSLTVGEVVVGMVGSRARHTVALVGPSVNIGARLLKQIPEGGIIASGEVVEALRQDVPALAHEFQLRDPAFQVPGGNGITIASYEVRDSSREPSRA
jgi:class 3 adenylate cyclase